MSFMGRIAQGSRRVTPFSEMGTSGTAIFGGYPQVRERDARVVGQQKWITYAEVATNFSIVAAGLRYFLNLIASSSWSVEPADDSAPAREVAEFVDSVINGMASSWPRVVRRSASYRFNGFGVQEWTAKRRKEDGRVGFEDIEVRPAHTIERWDVDERGTVLGMFQLSPQTGRELYLPRKKVIYHVDDTLTDSPEGIGVLRHLVEPATRLKRYLDLEVKGYERDMRGIPVGRAPYAAIAAAADAGKITRETAKQLTLAIEAFVQTQCKDVDTSIVLDSAPYRAKSSDGEDISQVYQWGVELLSGNSSGFEDIGKAVDRLNREMARILSMEQLMLGDGSGGNRALSEDKSRSLYLNVNSTLKEIGEGLDRDTLDPICSLNGIPDELRPHLKHSDVSFRSVQEITAALRDMGAAGAMLMPDDPAIDEIRGMLGLSPQPEIDPKLLGSLMGLPDKDPPSGDDDEDGDEDLDEAA